MENTMFDKAVKEFEKVTTFRSCKAEYFYASSKGIDLKD